MSSEESTSVRKKKKGGLSPTQRTMAHLRGQGRTCAIAEKWVSIKPPGKPQFGFRKDLFDFIDIVALDPVHGIVGVQCCAGSALSSHMTKIIVDCRENAEAWLQAKGKIEVWAWRKVKLKRHSRALRWQPRVINITMEFLEEWDMEDAAKYDEADDALS